MWTSDDKKLGNLIRRSMDENPQQWYAGEYRIYHPGLGILVRYSSISACGIEVKQDGVEVVDSRFSWPIVPLWRIRLKRACERVQRLRPFHGYVGEGDRREFIT